MKRAFLAILILATGTTVFCAFRSVNTGLRAELAAQQSAWQTQTQQLVQLRLEQQHIHERWNDTKKLLAAQPQLPALTQLAEKILSGAALTNLSAAESEQLLAELGFNWNTTGDYLIVSKKSLEHISFESLKGAQLSAAARGAFAITPGEAARVEAATKQVADARAAWAQEHVQRNEPGGKNVASYTLPADVDFARSQRASFTNSICSTLGEQRCQMFLDHAEDWLVASGLRLNPDISPGMLAMMPAGGLNNFQPKPIKLTVERYESGGEMRMNYTLEQSGSTMTTSVSPRQPFPEAFRTVFPGGWEELAQREGFELPAEFKDVKAR